MLLMMTDLSSIWPQSIVECQSVEDRIEEVRKEIEE